MDVWRVVADWGLDGKTLGVLVGAGLPTIAGRPAWVGALVGTVEVA